MTSFLKLQTHLKNEIKLYRRYISVLAREREELLAGNHDKLITLSTDRNLISRDMIICHKGRIALIKELFPEGSEKEKLSDLIERHCTPEVKVRLLPLVEELRREVERSQGEGREFKQVVNFALEMVSGAASIIWSATQNVVKGYNPKGELKESYHSKTRTSGVMKRA